MTINDEQAETPRTPSLRRKTAATIYDIARLADVNPSTVSRALSQPGRINIKTEERIRAAAKQLNYRVNPIARALPTGRTFTLGLIVADITNPVMFGVVRGAEQAAAAAGYTLVIAESQESGEREATAAERVMPSVDGLVLGTSRLSDDKIRELAERTPLVLINRDVEGVPSVLPDLRPGIEQAIHHLHSLGHTRIAYLAGPETSWISGRRGEMIAVVAAEQGMDLVEIGPGVPRVDGGRAAYSSVALAGVTAVLAYNDLMAIGLMREIAERGAAVPTVLSVVGFDDIFGADFTTPPLTTIRTPLDEAGRRAVSTLLGRIGSGDELLPTELVMRASTGTPPATRLLDLTN
ncbi:MULTISPECIES: LacI family DNA-binding transcriptional regulator [unclassified Diaminobutyricimonas]|uniref:LacI family DNA-binding transcriptional regulator n=1 Tax=unclassified Diaminobutyricimonas TaxID=2643261 RepID=UPI0018E0090A|nr:MULTISPECIES: LacI family DNA-binding transcriptional regulator [unclassified Diaminobutyricimonas]